MRYLFLIGGLFALTVMLVAGKRGDISRRPPIELFPDMDRQPKLRPQAANAFFANGMSSQPQVAGTIARGAHWEDTPMNTGRIPGTTNFIENLPVPVTAQLLARGQERFNINCAVCHGAQGDGKGITTKYGMVAVANFHDLRLVKMPDGEIFNAITVGKNLMGAYGAQVPIEDRWAIIAYVRALQRSRLTRADELAADARAKLPNAPPAPAK